MTPRRTNAKRRTVTTTHPTCGDCKQRITFIRMTDTGKALPCDPWPVPDGNVCATPSGRGLAGYVISADRPATPGWKRYAAHFGTCPERERPGRPRLRPFTPQQQQLDLFGGSDG